MQNLARGLLSVAVPTFLFPVFAYGADRSSTTDTGDDRQRLRGSLEEVIVTAQKREERLLETPVSISVLTGEALDNSSARGVTDVLNQVAGVAVTEIRPGQSLIVVRGVVPGSGSNTTAYYQDEVPFASVRGSELPDAGSFDLARVEVLRGPQGTLYGANSLSGVVRVLTNDANLDQFEAKGRVRASATQDGGENYGGDLVVNVPMIPGKLAVRAVAGYSELSGFIDSSDSFSSPSSPQEDINDTELENLRVKATWQPVDSLSLKFGYSRSNIINDALYMARDGLITPFSANQPDQRELNIYSLITEYQWPSVSLLSATGYLDYLPISQREILLAGTTAASASILDQLKSFSQELRFVSRGDGPWQWSAGAFYSDTNQRQRQEVPSVFQGVFRQNALSESYAAFFEATRSFDNDRFELTGGARYTNERQTLQDLGDLNPNVVLVPDQEEEFDKVTGRVVFAFKPTDASMFYGSVATGFRSGRILTPAVARQAPDFPSVDPDSLITYELGTKSGVFEGALVFDTSVYFMKWSDLQQLLVLPIGFGAIVNAGDASGMGADVSVSSQIGAGLNVSLSIGWNDLTYDQDIFQWVRAVQQSVLLFAKGARVNDSPEWTGSLGASYRVATPMRSTDLVVSGNYAYGSRRGSRFLTGVMLSETYSDEMQLLKLSVGLEGERWTVGIYGDNILNDDGAVTPPDATAANTSVRLRPRTIGVQVTYAY